MAKQLRYRATEKVYVDGVLYAAGDEFVSDKPPGDAWEPLDEAGTKAKSVYQAQRSAAVRARESALRHPEAHIGTAAPGNSAATHEQAAAIEAVPELGLSPAEASALTDGKSK